MEYKGEWCSMKIVINNTRRETGDTNRSTVTEMSSLSLLVKNFVLKEVNCPQNICWSSIKKVKSGGKVDDETTYTCINSQQIVRKFWSLNTWTAGNLALIATEVVPALALLFLVGLCLKRHWWISKHTPTKIVRLWTYHINRDGLSPQGDKLSQAQINYPLQQRKVFVDAVTIRLPEEANHLH